MLRLEMTRESKRYKIYFSVSEFLNGPNIDEALVFVDLTVV